MPKTTRARLDRTSPLLRHTLPNGAVIEGVRTNLFGVIGYRITFISGAQTLLALSGEALQAMQDIRSQLTKPLKEKRK